MCSLWEQKSCHNTRLIHPPKGRSLTCTDGARAHSSLPPLIAKETRLCGPYSELEGPLEQWHRPSKCNNAISWLHLHRLLLVSRDGGRVAASLTTLTRLVAGSW